MLRAGQCARAANWYGTSMMVYLGAKAENGALIMSGESGAHSRKNNINADFCSIVLARADPGYIG